MGPRYAGILGFIAFATTLVRGWLVGTGFESAIVTAVVYLFVFALIGWMVGSIATTVIIQSVKDRLRNELAQRELEKQAALQEVAQNVNPGQ